MYKDKVFYLHEFSPERLDKALLRVLKSFSREKIKRLIQGGFCLVDNLPCLDAAKKIRPGQKIVLHIPAETSSLTPEPGEVKIIWQDTAIIIVDKPPNLTVHPASSCPQGTLIQRLLNLCPALQGREGLRPGIVHRLDKDTSGLMVVAPNEESRLKLSRAFARREVHKHYLALVAGVPPEYGNCIAPIGRHPTLKTRMAVVPRGRAAHTEWRRIYADPLARFSLLDIRLHTGRTHQIRVHMAHLGHPLIGDTTYAPGNIARLAPRQMLHAWKLSFVHPLTEEPMNFASSLPEDFRQSFADLGKRALRVVLTGLPGCGKSLLGQIFKEADFPVFSADEVVKNLYEPGAVGWQVLRERYGEIYAPSGKGVDKVHLAQDMQKNSDLRHGIEALIHPLVNDELARFWKQADEDKKTLAIAEVPLWLECGGAQPKYGPDFGRVLLLGLNCPQNTRHERLRHKRGWAEHLVAAADSWQWPENKKIAACDIVIDNDKDEAALRHKADGLMTKLLEIHKQEMPELEVLLDKYVLR